MGIPLRLLILEDNPSDAELVLHTLRRAGYDPIADQVPLVEWEVMSQISERFSPDPQDRVDGRKKGRNDYS